MNNDIDMEELEQDQLDYIRRNYDKTANIPNSTDMNLDILEKPIDERIILTPQQEEELVKRILLKQKQHESKIDNKFSLSLSRYFDILSNSFIDIMDDILNFNGNLEEFPSILTKNDRLVLIGTIMIIICLLFLNFRSNVQNPN